MTKVLAAIVAITILESFAVWQGIDGAILGVGIAAIAGLAGYEVHKIKKPK